MDRIRLCRIRDEYHFDLSTPRTDVPREAFCPRCRTKVDLGNPERITMRDGKPVLKGT